MSEMILGPLRGLKLAGTRAYSRALRAVAGVRYHQLVVCGYPRSGTSLLYNMLSTTVDGFDFEGFERPSIYRIHRLGNIASKYPLDVFNVTKLPSLNVLDKTLSVIVMVRDPRDLLTSRHPMLPDRYFIGHDHSWWPQDPDFANWKYDAPGIVEIHHEIAALEAQDAIPLVTVRYEDLVADPDAVQARLAGRFDLDFQGTFSGFHEHGDRMAYSYSGRTEAKDETLVRENKPADASRHGKWKKDEHADRIRDQFAECPELFAIVRGYGYEDDDGWYAAYEG